MLAEIPDIIELGLLTVIIVLGVVDIKVTSLKSRPQIVKQADFKCPYCPNLVTGDNVLDLNMHVQCIEDAKLFVAQQLEREKLVHEQRVQDEERQLEKDREKEARKAAEKAARDAKREVDERAAANTYTVNVQPIHDRMSLVHQKFCKAEWRVTKGLDKTVVDKGLSENVVSGQREAELAVQNHKDGNPPLGELMSNYSIT